MTIASVGTAVTLAGRAFTGIAVASIALVTGTASAAATGNPGVQWAYAAIVPAQLSMDRKTAPNAPPPKKRTSVRTRSDGALTPGEQRRLAEAIDRMTPKERKRLAKAMKHLSPETRRQLAEIVSRRLAGAAAPSPAVKPAR